MTVRVCRFRAYDIGSDTIVISRRMATTEAISSIGAYHMAECLEVDESRVNQDGFTDLDFWASHGPNPLKVGPNMS